MSGHRDAVGPIVLLHGLIGTLDHAGILAPFGNRVVLAPDLLGYGAHRDRTSKKPSLADQADHVAAFLRRCTSAPVHVVGHSVGGAVGVLLACRHPELVRSLTSVEGNMTLDDAFWSADIARQPLVAVERLLERYGADIDRWLAGAGVVPTAWTRGVAAHWIDAQPAATLRAQSAAVVRATGDSTYLRSLERRLAAGLPLYLVAGERSFGGWNLSERIRVRAVSLTVVPGVGHLMMLEAPGVFARAVLDGLQPSAGGSR